jgi:NADH-quinone oxidoreductase subunit G
LKQGAGEAIASVSIDNRVPVDCVRFPSGHPLSAALGPLFGPIEATAVALEERKAG